MFKAIRPFFVLTIILGILTACTPAPTPEEPGVDLTVQALVEAITSATPEPSPTPEPPSVLTVCMGQEPSSLFMYADTTAAARGILQAIYDGPFDRNHGQVQPVILERIPSLQNGDAELRPVEVVKGDVIVDAEGHWVTLNEQTRYRPSGCTSADCAQAYAGDQSVLMDALAVRFRLLPGLLWSDGTPLTAQDSVYSFNIAQAFYGNVSDALRYTQSYTALDAQTVEWFAIPGYQGAYATNFFSPLPEHILGAIDMNILPTSELAARNPLGWGAYAFEEWISGDHITLHRNENYFRSAEGLPRFEYLVFRFVDGGSAAVDALLVGECDYIDQTALTLNDAPRLLEAQSGGQIGLNVENDTSWEQAVFGLNTFSEARANLFASREVRQAIAMCIDRQGMVDGLLSGLAAASDGYLPAEHILFPTELPTYPYDPQAALELLASVGWVDSDQNADTPLTALGRTDIADGSPFAFDYWVPEDPPRQAAANWVQASLSECGIHVNIKTQPWEQFLSPGPDGAVFGRRFDMAQFAWSIGQIAPCFLFTSDEIPGPLPDFAKGWGGGNIAGYSNPEFDLACRTAQTTLPDTPEYLQAQQRAQMVFAQDLPAVPLYWNPEISAYHTDICARPGTMDIQLNLMNIESFAGKDDCRP